MTEREAICEFHFHRGLKPANIKITPESKVKVLDFGLARVLAGDVAAGNLATSPTLTIAATTIGVILGTAAYMSPEQARGAVAGKRSDIWSFGVVLYELLTRKHLFEGESISGTLAAVLRQEIDSSMIPAPLRKLIQRCLTRDRRKRLQDISEARIMLDEPPQEEMREQAPARRGRWAPWVAAGALAIVLAALALAHFRDSIPPRHALRLMLPAPEIKRVFSFAVSPDGRHLAIAGGGEDCRSLCVRAHHPSKLPRQYSFFRRPWRNHHSAIVLRWHPAASGSWLTSNWVVRRKGR